MTQGIFLLSYFLIGTILLFQTTINFLNHVKCFPAAKRIAAYPCGNVTWYCSKSVHCLTWLGMDQGLSHYKLMCERCLTFLLNIFKIYLKILFFSLKLEMHTVFSNGLKRQWPSMVYEKITLKWSILEGSTVGTFLSVYTIGTIHFIKNGARCWP